MPRAGTRTNVQKAALAVGAVFLLVGLFGLIPGITSQYDQLSFAGHESGAMLHGIFQVSVLHTIVRLLFGVATSRTISGEWATTGRGSRKSRPAAGWRPCVAEPTSAGGTLLISSAPGHGTDVVLTVPLRD